MSKTGDFGIKLSDVQLDIDKRIEWTRSYKTSCLFIKEEIETATKSYNTARSTYIYLSRLSDRMNGLYLKSNDVTEESLKYLIYSYDSTMHSLDMAQKNIKEIRNKDYLQNLTTKTINHPDEDGFDEIDLHKPDVELWDYKKWSLDVLDVINTRIKPLRVKVKEYRQKLKGLTSDNTADVKALEDLGLPPFSDELLELDENSLGLTYINLEWMKFKFVLESDSLKNELLMDPEHYDNLILGHKGVLKILVSVDSLLGRVGRGAELKQESLKYTEFLEEMKDVELLEGSIVDDAAEYLGYTRLWNSRLENLNSLARYAIVGSDSIPMFIHPDSTAATNDVGYIALNSVRDDSSRWYINGLVNLNDSTEAEAFVARVRPNRVVDWKTKVPIDFVVSSEVDFFVSSITMVAGERASVLFYAKIPGEKVYKCKILAFDETGQIRWKHSFDSNGKPGKIEWDEAALTTIITTGSQNVGINKVRLSAEGKPIE